MAPRKALDHQPEDKPAEAIRYALSRWTGLTLFLDDGRIKLDNNVVERFIWPLALSRKNSLFAGSDGGAGHWAILASLIETAKLRTSTRRPTSPASSPDTRGATSISCCPGHHAKFAAVV